MLHQAALLWHGLLGQLPVVLTTRVAQALSQSRWPPLKNLLIRRFVRSYQVDTREAEFSDPLSYPDFNSFFTRRLRPGARPIATGLVSPCDGRLAAQGRCSKGRAIQAKGMDYSVTQLLGSSPHGPKLADGCFLTLYLAPRHYHRVHLPVPGELLSTERLPGRLHAVNPGSSSRIERLYLRNERLVAMFETPLGLMALVMVAAIGVSGIRLTRPDIPSRRHPPGLLDHRGLHFQAGDEFGYFEMGSTVILVFEDAALLDPLAAREGEELRMGQALLQR